MYSQSSKTFLFNQCRRLGYSPNLGTLFSYNNYEFEQSFPLNSTCKVRTLFTSIRCDKSVKLVVQKAEDLIKTENVKRLKKIFKCTNDAAYAALQLPESRIDDKTEKIEQLKKIFKCDEDQATKALSAMQLPESSLEDIVRKVKWLLMQKATLPVILNNCELLLRPFGMYYDPWR